MTNLTETVKTIGRMLLVGVGSIGTEQGIENIFLPNQDIPKTLFVLGIFLPCLVLGIIVTYHDYHTQNV